MAEDRQEQKETKEDAEEEAIAESTLTTEPTLSEDEHEPSANATGHDPPEVLCPGHIILVIRDQETLNYFHLDLIGVVSTQQPSF